MQANSDMYDTSDFPPDHFLHSNENKKVIGKFKDETNGDPILEFVGLRAKMYSMRMKSSEKNVAKGVSKAVIRNKLTFDKYKESLFKCQSSKAKMVRFQSENHQIYTVETNKIALSPADDKRYLCDDGIRTLAYGHIDIEMEQILQAQIGNDLRDQAAMAGLSPDKIDGYMIDDYMTDDYVTDACAVGSDEFDHLFI
jgi:hypothetical protein